MGRDLTHGAILGSDLRANAGRTVEAANKLLTLAKGAGLQLRPNAATGMVRSGWRPPDINGTTQGASKTSWHMQCLAVDLEDVDRTLGRWCFANQNVLKDLALWLEEPTCTPPAGDTRRGWCHVQLKPPGSGNRVFRP